MGSEKDEEGLASMIRTGHGLIFRVRRAVVRRDHDLKRRGGKSGGQAWHP